MIENYKGWEIALTWQDKSFIEFISNDNKLFNQNKKWVGIDLKGKKIYGSSLKEIRHIIDYPNLHNR
ncbi:MAG: hypothetical protein CMK49_03415 [Prochlorococcus sp. SP3034]|nr:hypothetical protein [Prochlorococcus sp. SP3034]|tara:strand:+ start:332 stop:532 length:201 start_codon:yes stop_codon:yes gene_type:complete